MKLKSGEEKEARRAIYEGPENITDLPEGISFNDPPETFDNDEVSASLIAMGLSIIFIYMLIAFLFESVLMPLSIVLTIPPRPSARSGHTSSPEPASTTWAWWAASC